MEVIFILAAVYSVISYLIGIIDLFRLRTKKKGNKGIASMPTQDLREFLGLHNWIFFPSVFIVLIVVGAIKLISGVFN